MHTTAQALDECRHPVVAQIHGICVGDGLEIALKGGQVGAADFFVKARNGQ